MKTVFDMPDGCAYLPRDDSKPTIKMNAQREYQLETKPHCVIADGPQETDGDGGFEYTVCFGDDEGNVIDENRRAIWRLWEYDEVCKFGEQLARKYGLEFLNEASPA